MLFAARGAEILISNNNLLTIHMRISFYCFSHLTGARFFFRFATFKLHCGGEFSHLCVVYDFKRTEWRKKKLMKKNRKNTVLGWRENVNGNFFWHVVLINLSNTTGYILPLARRNVGDFRFSVFFFHSLVFFLLLPSFLFDSIFISFENCREHWVECVQVRCCEKRLTLMEYKWV